MMFIDDTTAVMPQEVFERLAEYSCSLPTGTVIGKRWRSARTTHVMPPRAVEETSIGEPLPGRIWLMGEYYALSPDENPRGDLIGIRWRRIYQLEVDAAPQAFREALAMVRMHASFADILRALPRTIELFPCLYEPSGGRCSYCISRVEQQRGPGPRRDL